MSVFSSNECANKHACHIVNFNIESDVELHGLLRRDVPTLLGLILTLAEPSKNRCFKSKVSICVQEFCRNTALLVGRKRQDDTFCNKTIESLVRICSRPIIIESNDKVEVRYLMAVVYHRAASLIELDVPVEFTATYWRYKQIALDLKISAMLENQRTAKEIYDYLSTNRSKAVFPFALLRDAVSLKHMSAGNQNRAIRNGLQKLENLGLINFELSESLVTGEITVMSALT